MKTVMQILFIGSYTEYPIPSFGGIGHGIYTVQLNTENGELSTLNTEWARNPSYLTISHDNRFLYCNTELDENENPKVRAYKINKDFSLDFLNEMPISGGYPCHINIYKKNVLVACYATGNVLQFPIEVSGKLMSSKKIYCHNGSSINKARQEGPHAHQVAVHPNKKDIYVSDLGIDTLKAYDFQGTEMVPADRKDVAVSKGGGPRHLVFNREGNLAYVVNELTGSISVLHHQGDKFVEINTYSSLPSNFSGQISASAIRIHPNGKFLYAANRKLEAISIFEIEKATLRILDYQYTGGEELREFNITPCGKWLIACHQNSHDTVVFKIENDGTLFEKYRTKEFLSPSCVAFMY